LAGTGCKPEARERISTQMKEVTKCFSAAVSFCVSMLCLSSVKTCSRMSRRGGAFGPCGIAEILADFDFEETRLEEGVKEEEPIIERNVRAARIWMSQFPPRVRNTFLRASCQLCMKLFWRRWRCYSWSGMRPTSKLKT